MRTLRSTACVALLLPILTCAPEPPRKAYERAIRLLAPDDLRVAHALGAINRTRYSNTRQALELRYSQGYRWFEVDLATTSDGILVCFHERLERKINLAVRIDQATAAEFLEHEFKGRLTLMTFRDLLEEMRGRPDMVLVTDTKRLTPAILARLEMDIESVDRDLRRRIVVQIYHRDELDFTLEAERRNGPFGGIIFTLYQTRISNADLLHFVEDTGLEWITMSRRRFDPELTSRLHDLGARVFVATLNKPQAVRRFQESGADGIYTDNSPP